MAGAPCILETYIGNIVVWKHHWRLETKNAYWKHTLDIGNISLYIGNIKLDWKHKSVYWKHKIRLETNFGYWKHQKSLET